MAFFAKRKSGLCVIILTTIFVTFSYFCLRNILTYYLKKRHNIELDIGVKYLTLFTILYSTTLLPFGLITDFFLGQKKAIITGSIISIIGFIVFLFNRIELLRAALILIAVGLALVRMNLFVLTGRLFAKTEIKRDIAFLLIFFAINIGALLAPLLSSYSDEIGISWNYYFILPVLGMLAGLIVFIAGSRKFNLIEVDLPHTNSSYSRRNIVSKRISLILIVLILEMIFNSYNFIDNINFEFVFHKYHLFCIGTYKIPKTLIISADGIFLIPASLIMIVYWYFVKIQKPIVRIGISFLLYSIALFSIISALFYENITIISFTVMSIFNAFAAIFISSVVYSYITRLTPIKYSSTLIGTYLLITHFIPSTELYLSQEKIVSAPFLIIIAVLSCTIGTSLLLIQKRLIKLGHGI